MHCTLNTSDGKRKRGCPTETSSKEKNRISGFSLGLMQPDLPRKETNLEDS